MYKMCSVNKRKTLDLKLIIKQTKALKLSTLTGFCFYTLLGCVTLAMGFRSTIVSEHYSGTLPNWFKDKYSDRLLFPDGLLIVSKAEWKYYSNDLFDDYRKSLIEIGFFDNITDNISFTVGIAVMAEDQFISKVLIGKDEIKYIWMKDSFDSDHVWCQG